MNVPGKQQKDVVPNEMRNYEIIVEQHWELA